MPRFIKIKRVAVACATAAILAAFGVTVTLILAAPLHWPDRRPIGILFLASNYHSSAANPRGWFNDPALDVTGTNGAARFRSALLAYADHSITVLKQVGAQGVIVWDLEGEQFPQKTSYIGDPRLIGRLAPEMAPVVDEFLARFKQSGFRVGMTVRPQHLVFDEPGLPKQAAVWNIKRCLLEKIDYARTRWGASLFYIDSNGGIRRPDEAWQLRSLAAQRPDILLIPEHHTVFYRSFAAPYVRLRNGESSWMEGWGKKLFPRSFQALDIGDATNEPAAIGSFRAHGEILLFRAWYWNRDCDLLEPPTSRNTRSP